MLNFTVHDIVYIYTLMLHVLYVCYMRYDFILKFPKLQLHVKIIYNEHPLQVNCFDSSLLLEGRV